MCARVIQSSGALNFTIVDGMNVRDSRVHNYAPRWNAGPSQDLLVIRRNHRTGEVSLDPLRWGGTWGKEGHKEESRPSKRIEPCGERGLAMPVFPSSNC
jgi:putative SOS response-associated peptidase YedK